MAYVRPNLDEIVAGLPGVQARVHAVAVQVEFNVKAAIARHSRTGRLFRSVSVERAFKGKDYWVYISAPYAVAANYGHESNWTIHRVKGINFLKAAVYATVSR